MKVFLDAGHGGTDPGATGFGRIEKNDVLNLTMKVGHHLRLSGINVGLIRSTDVFVKVNDRPAIANNNNADYFVSFHRNAGGGTGCETWIHSNNVEPDRRLAQEIQDEITKSYKDRGVKRGYPGAPTDNYAINRLSNMPSCLVEVGFMDTEADNVVFANKVEQLAIGIARGICKAVGVKFHQTSEPTPPPTPAPVPPTPQSQNMVVKVDTPEPKIIAMGHTAFMGWDKYATSLIGTTGKGLRLEAFRIALKGLSGKLSGRVHMANKGWVSHSDIKQDTILGTENEHRQVEAIELKLENANGKRLQYRVHIAFAGWQNWREQGEIAGTEGEGIAIEAIEFRLV